MDGSLDIKIDTLTDIFIITSNSNIAHPQIIKAHVDIYTLDDVIQTCTFDPRVLINSQGKERHSVKTSSIIN